MVKTRSKTFSKTTNTFFSWLPSRYKRKTTLPVVPDQSFLCHIRLLPFKLFSAGQWVKLWDSLALWQLNAFTFPWSFFRSLSRSSGSLKHPFSLIFLSFSCGTGAAPPAARTSLYTEETRCRRSAVCLAAGFKSFRRDSELVRGRKVFVVARKCHV